MQTTKPEKQVSELSYHGPLIGMRSTRPQPATSTNKTETGTKRSI